MAPMSARLLRGLTFSKDFDDMVRQEGNHTSVLQRGEGVRGSCGRLCTTASGGGSHVCIENHGASAEQRSISPPQRTLTTVRD